MVFWDFACLYFRGRKAWNSHNFIKEWELASEFGSSQLQALTIYYYLLRKYFSFERMCNCTRQAEPSLRDFIILQGNGLRQMQKSVSVYLLDILQDVPCKVVGNNLLRRNLVSVLAIDGHIANKKEDIARLLLSRMLAIEWKGL